MMLNGSMRSSARVNTIDTLIRDTLCLELPECYDELRISEYRQKIYEYVYTRYKGVA